MNTEKQKAAQTATPRKVLVTAALPYSNGRPHVGHLAGAYIPSDIYVRYLRATGAEVRYVCGSDDYGVAITIAAEKEGKTPAELASFYREAQARAFKGARIDFDVYSGTSVNPYHSETSQKFFKAIHDKGYFEKQSSRQFFDEERQVFLPDRYVKGECGFCGTPDQNGDQCENCGRELDVDSLKNATSTLSGKAASVRDTIHWFLDLSRFQPQVESWLENATLRDHTRANVGGMLSTGLVKRAMTRDINWGIPVPLEDPDAKGKVLYVWFDAPIGYISNTMLVCNEKEGDPSKADDWWRSDDTEIFHFIGEDNTVFHCIIWIAMLNAEGTIKLPKGVIVNQFLNIQFGDKEAEKISKSRGAAVWVEDLLAEGVDADSVRYYLTCIAPERSRSVYRPEDLRLRHNGELADALGNLVNRITSFTIKHCGPNVPSFDTSKVTPRDEEFRNALELAHAEATQELEAFGFKAALERIMEFTRECNRYVDDKAPWTSRKTDMEATKVTLAYCLNAIHALGIMLTPFIPNATKKILAAFGREQSACKWNEALTYDVVGSALSQPEILFRKMEAAEGDPAA